VLDYSHCKEYLHKVAKAPYDSPQRALEWVEATLTRLYLGKVGGVLGGLRRMQPASESLFEKYQAASRLSINRVIATYTNVSLVVGNSS
jgi:hypothetical protein